MKIELVDLEEFSGNKAHIYSVLLDDAEDTLFDQFIEENRTLYYRDLREIVKQLKVMGDNTGCQIEFFKLNEGRLGDGVAAIWSGRIRLYCLRFDSSLIIVGDGGYKSPKIRAYQARIVAGNFTNHRIGAQAEVKYRTGNGRVELGAQIGTTGYSV